MNKHISHLAASIIKRLEFPLPGKEAQYKMAPEARNFKNFDREYRNAAVLLLIFPEKNILSLPLIKRTKYDGPHSGQISLPGGMSEVFDNDLCDTALRETKEEIGVNKENITILGKLSPLHIPVSNFKVHPYIGISYKTPHFNTENREVERMLQLPIEHFTINDNLKSEYRTLNSKKIRIPYYSAKGEKIWGATAMILSEFTQVLIESAAIIE